MATELSALPGNLIAGDSYRITLTDARYPASAGWVLSLVLTGAAASLTDTATAAGDSHVFALTSAKTAPLTAGSYRYALFATKDGERETVGNPGVMPVLPDIATAPGGSLASYAETMLGLCKTARENILRGELKSYQINGRTVALHTLAELAKEEAHWRREVARERNGGARFSTLAVRFVR